MAQRPKDIGTAFTSSVIAYLRIEGFGTCELRNQAGSRDMGDIVGIPGLVIECKGGHAAETAGDMQIVKWLAETEAERRNANADIGVLVTKRPAVGKTRAGFHWAWFVLDALAALDGLGGRGGRDRVALEPVALAPVRLRLDHATTLLRLSGYGDLYPHTRVPLAAGVTS